MREASLPATPTALVICLCAQWCGTCRDYQPVFAPMQARFAQARFLWVDVEDESELVDPVEVENFPTLLIAHNGRARFFGPLTPQPEMLERLVQASLAADAPNLPVGGEAQLLLQRIVESRSAS